MIGAAIPIVAYPGVNASKAMPVTMPGSAMGRISRVAKASLPGKRSRFMAVAVKVPSSMAMAVAMAATLMDK